MTSDSGDETWSAEESNSCPVCKGEHKRKFCTSRFAAYLPDELKELSEVEKEFTDKFTKLPMAVKIAVNAPGPFCSSINGKAGRVVAIPKNAVSMSEMQNENMRGIKLINARRTVPDGDVSFFHRISRDTKVVPVDKFFKGEFPVLDEKRKERKVRDREKPSAKKNPKCTRCGYLTIGPFCGGCGARVEKVKVNDGKPKYVKKNAEDDVKVGGQAPAESVVNIEVIPDVIFEDKTGCLLPADEPILRKLEVIDVTLTSVVGPKVTLRIIVKEQDASIGSGALVKPSAADVS